MELNRYVYAIGNPVNYSDPSGYTALNDIQQIKFNTIKAFKTVKYYAGKPALAFVQI
jgi:hypothetical protein